MEKGIMITYEACQNRKIKKKKDGGEQVAEEFRSFSFGQNLV